MNSYRKQTMWANPEAIWATGTGARATRHSAPIPSAISRQIFLSFFFPANMIHALTPSSVGWNLAQSLAMDTDATRRDATRARIPCSSTGTSLCSALLCCLYSSRLCVSGAIGFHTRTRKLGHRLHSDRQQT